MGRPEHLYTTETLPSDFTEPFSGNLYDRAHGAMPANPFRNEQVKKRQAMIEGEFLKLFITPPAELNVPQDFQQLFQDDYQIGERRRQMTNFNNYMTWRKTNPDIPASIQDQVDRYEAGTAEVEDVIDIALNTDITNGLEVGRVTHPYWQRMEHVLPLREHTAEAISTRGGRLEPWIAPYRSISIVPNIQVEDRVQSVTGFIVPYKHDVGTIVRPTDGKVLHIVERQIAGIRVDEPSGFSQGVLRRMHEVSSSKDNFDWSNVNDERFEQHICETGARGFIEKAVQTDSSDLYLVPESTTLYIFAEDPETSKHLGRVAFHAPDKDDGIAYYNSELRIKKF